MSKGGAQRVMSNLVNYFGSNENEVVLINDYMEEKKSQFYINGSVKRVYLQQHISKSRIWANMVRVIRLRSMVKTYKPDVIVSFLGMPNYRMLAATIGLKIRKVVSVRSDPNLEYGKKRLSKLIASGLFDLADACVFQTEQAKDYFSKKICNKSYIILNPVDEAFYSVEKTERKKTKDIVATGNLRTIKNHRMLIDAFASIANCIPEDNLYIYGEGPCRGELEDQINKLGLKDRVFLPGQIDNVHKVLKKAKLYVLSSNAEGLPNGLMEAMASGVACIATDCPCGGPRQLFNDEQCGRLVEVGDAQGLALMMKKLITDERARLYLEKSARNRSLDFRYDKVMMAWEKVIKNH